MRTKRSALKYLPAAILAAAFIISLGFRTAQPGFVPVQAAKNLWAALRLLIAQIFRQPLYLRRFDVIAAHPYYHETLIRLKNSVVTLGSGVAVCLGGAAFQTMFRNPLASPNILGVSTGVNLGTAVFMLTYTTQSLSMMDRRYLYCYAMAGLLVLLACGAGKLAGRRVGRFSVADMLIVGTIISQFGNVLVLYFQYKLTEIDEDLLAVFQELSMGVYVLTDLKTMLLFFGGLAAGLVPVILLRYRFNAAAFDDEHALSMGVRVGLLRGVGMICGGILAITALVHCGSMGIISMAVPYICRGGKGADFRRVAYLSACVGGSVMLLARSVCSMIYIAGLAMPVNFAISLLILPAFVLAISGRREAFS